MTSQTQTVTVAKPSLEHHREHLGIGQATPRLSWIVQTELQNWLQAAYEIEVSRADQTQTSGRMNTTDSVLQPWPFAPLQSREHVSLRVRVWGQDGSSSDWSEALEAEAGLLNVADWRAQFVGHAWTEDVSKLEPSPYLRREFELHKPIKQARLYISALGVYEPYLNGKVVGDHVLAPGWTSYSTRLRYQTFDVTDMLHVGHNAIGALLGDGWYRGRLGFGGGRRNIYGSQIALLAQLEVEYQDGSSEIIISDESWKAHKSPIVSSGIYDGETYDARLEISGWAEPGFDDANWSAVTRVEHDFKTLFAPVGPPVRRTETIAAIKMWQSPSGNTLVDFGQNLVGWLRLSVRGNSGQTITLRHAEVLENGELGVRPLRHALQVDTYTLRGSALETWEPRFTFHGFRYAEITGWPDLKIEDVTAIVVHSDLERRGWFECSDALVNQLHQNVIWSMRGNFLDIPTDCPQRDERLGWTGDIQVFTPTASFLYNSAGFLESWLADLAAEQSSDGVVPFIIPNIISEGMTATAAWGDAVTVVPWVLYQRYGDAGILEKQYASMKAWVDHLERLCGPSRLWEHGFQFGDWLDPDAPPEQADKAKTIPAIVATAYFARSTEFLAKSADVLGKLEDARKYHQLHTEIRAAFAQEYVTPSGRMVSDATTGYALALEFDLLSPEQRQRAGERLLALVRQSRFHISTGFVGTPLICDALCHVGATQAAFRLLTQTTCPSWLYPVTMGATTIWERWDSMLQDGSINPGEMTSFNHYALGAVADWLHRTVAGLAPLEPAYRRFEIAPKIGGGMTHASARHKTPYGIAEVVWKLEGDQLEINATVPANTQATVRFPGSSEVLEVGSGTYRWVRPFTFAAQRKPYSLETKFAEIVDDAHTLQTVEAIMAAHSPETAHIRAAILKGALEKPLGDAVSVMPQSDELRRKLTDALAAMDDGMHKPV
jgi:alpha-L-rhamnosidase